MQVARRWQEPGVPIYVIDLSKVKGTLIDLTDDVVRNKLFNSNRKQLGQSIGGDTA